MRREFSALYFVRKEIKSPYFNPRLRWWETAKRYAFNLQTDISSLDGGAPIVTSTFDISESGAFLVSDHSFSAAQMIDMTIRFDDVALPIKGQVMWVSEGRGRAQRHRRKIRIRFKQKVSNIWLPY